jgi:hypothetical protein
VSAFDGEIAAGYSRKKGREAMRYLPIIVVLASPFAAGCAAAQSAAQPVNTPPAVPAPVASAPFTNPAISASLTCDALLPMLHAADKRPGGFAIIWLDGYYSARAGITGLPANWSHTLSQGIGGTCTMDVNASRTVLDVIAQLHREYGGADTGH